MLPHKRQVADRARGPLRLLIVAVVSWLLATSVGGSLGASFAQVPPSSGVVGGPPEEYRIGPLDVLGITVFQIKDLTLDKVQVDASGQILLPLVGVVDAGGKTARELSAEIARRLEATYLRDPQVSVLVEEAASQKITIEGAVTESGVFPLKGRATLLQAIAMAKGPSKTADIKHVVVFRPTPSGATRDVYNVSDVERGKIMDPEIRGSDVVVVPESRGKMTFANVVAASPVVYLLALFH